MDFGSTDNLDFKRLHPDAKLPTRATDGSAGADFYSVEAVTLQSNTPILVRTGWAIALPRGFALLVIPRSGFAYKENLTVANSPGLIDSDYRGELMVMMFNRQPEPFFIGAGERIAQSLIIREYTSSFRFVEVQELPTTARGEGGFGSTGKL